MPSMLQPSAQEFETTFADLAHAHLRDRAPRLLDYLLGFQVIDVNEEQTHSVAIMAFDVSGQSVYVPIFFLNGEIKMNQMFLVDQDVLLPLQDNWVDYIINRKPSRIGEYEPKRENALGVIPPTLSTLSGGVNGSDSSFMYRYASDRTSVRSRKTMPSRKAIKKTCEAILTSNVRPSIDLPAFLRKASDYGVSTSLLLTMRRNHRLADAVLDFYKLSDLDVPRTKRAAARPSGLIPPAGHSVLSPRSEDRRVSVLEPTDAGMPFLGDRDRETLLRGGFVVKDARENANEILLTDESISLQNPTRSGHYRMLLDDQTFADVYIGVPPIAIGMNEVRTALVISKKDGSCGYWWIHNLWCIPRPEVELSQDDEWLNSLPMAEDVQIGNTYAFIDQCGACTIAMRVTRKNQLSSGRVELDVYPEAIRATSSMHHRVSSGSSGFLTGSSQHDYRSPYASEPFAVQGVSRVVIADDDRKIRLSGALMIVPKSSRAARLKYDEESNMGHTWAMADPGSLLTLRCGLLRAGVQELTLKKASDGIYVNGHGPHDRRQVMIGLIKKSGLRHKAVDLISEWLDKRGSVGFMIKNCVGYAPPIPDPPMFSDGGYGGYGTVAEGPIDMSLPTMDSDVAQYSRQPEEIAPLDIRAVIQAANTGQKEVFDAAAIGSLVRTTDSDDLINRYISDIMLGMDRVNRILFVYYWANDKFRDRYGSENMRELEDQLKNAAKSTGDLVLFLKQRRVDGATMTDSMDLQIGGGDSN